jgi:hypothetical protein
VPIADRIPELDLDQQSVEWRTLDDGSDGAYFANAGEDLHAVGSLAPIIRRLHRLHRDQAGWQPLRGPLGARSAGATAGLMKLRDRRRSRAAGLARAFKRIESAQTRWRAVNAPSRSAGPGRRGVRQR